MRAYPPQRCDVCGDHLDVHCAARGYCSRQSCIAAAVTRGIARREAGQRAQVQAVAEAHRDQLVKQHPALAQQGLEVLVVPGLEVSFLPAGESRCVTLSAHVDQILSMCALPCGDTAVEALAATGDAATIGVAACTACQGYCCRKGGDSAYLTGATIARIRAQFPDLSDADIATVYQQSIPAAGATGSCIFHGLRGCTLRRDFRADICNTYFCKPLAQMLDSGSRQAVVAVVVEDLRVKRSVLATR